MVILSVNSTNDNEIEPLLDDITDKRLKEYINIIKKRIRDSNRIAARMKYFKNTRRPRLYYRFDDIYDSSDPAFRNINGGWSFERSYPRNFGTRGRVRPRPRQRSRTGRTRRPRRNDDNEFFDQNQNSPTNDTNRIDTNRIDTNDDNINISINVNLDNQLEELIDSDNTITFYSGTDQNNYQWWVM